MAEAYIYDAVRTPRGKGKKDGSLHEITALELATQVLQGLRDRNNLDTALVDDVILGCVMPVGEQGGDIRGRRAGEGDADIDRAAGRVERNLVSRRERQRLRQGHRRPDIDRHCRSSPIPFVTPDERPMRLGNSRLCPENVSIWPNGRPGGRLL